MAHVANYEHTHTAASVDKKAYALTFKGLIRHAWDILFVRSEKTAIYATDLPEHLRKDIGL